MPITEVNPAQKPNGSLKENAFPRGLKIALIVSMTTIVVVVGLFTTLMVVSGEVQDEAKIKNIASSFMKIADPLPEGFSYTSGVDFLGTKMVMISQAESGSVWTMLHIPAAEGAIAPESVIHQIEDAASNSRRMLQSPGKFVVRQKGMQAVGGRSLFYETGELSTDKLLSGSLIGCFTPDKNGTTCIFCTTPLNKFDSFANDELLHTISSI